MAIIHQADLRPSKLELLTEWLPTQPWFGGQSPSLQAIGAYRFDDPDGEVGVETHVVRSADGRLLQLPLTYRAAPVAGAETFLVGTLEHSVLGRRWVYDGCGDHVYAGTLAAAILGGGTEVGEFVETEDGPVERAATVNVIGSGSADDGVRAADQVREVRCDDAADGPVATITTAGLELRVYRVIDPTADPSAHDGHTLTGTWRASTTPTLLATARRL